MDASNLKRSLYLTTQLIELNVPVVVALNMMDQIYHTCRHIETEKGKVLPFRQNCFATMGTIRKELGSENLLGRPLDSRWALLIWPLYDLMRKALGYIRLDNSSYLIIIHIVF